MIGFMYCEKIEVFSYTVSKFLKNWMMTEAMLIINCKLLINGMQAFLILLSHWSHMLRCNLIDKTIVMLQ